MLLVGQLLLCPLQLSARLIVRQLEVLALRNCRRQLGLHLFDQLILLLLPFPEVLFKLLREMLVVPLNVLNFGILLVEFYL